MTTEPGGRLECLAADRVRRRGVASLGGTEIDPAAKRHRGEPILVGQPDGGTLGALPFVIAPDVREGAPSGDEQVGDQSQGVEMLGRRQGTIGDLDRAFVLVKEEGDARELGEQSRPESSVEGDPGGSPPCCGWFEQVQALVDLEALRCMTSPGRRSLEARQLIGPPSPHSECLPQTSVRRFRETPFGGGLAASQQKVSPVWRRHPRSGQPARRSSRPGRRNRARRHVPPRHATRCVPARRARRPRDPRGCWRARPGSGTRARRRSRRCRAIRSTAPPPDELVLRSFFDSVL